MNGFPEGPHDIKIASIGTQCRNFYLGVVLRYTDISF